MMPPKIVSKDQNYVSPLQKLQSKSKSQNPGKRIRVSRACDNCRKRKVKCDGKQPCIYCTVYSFECTYNYIKTSVTPNKKLKITNEEKKKKNGNDAEKLNQTIMRMIFPEIDVSDPEFNLELFVQVFQRHKHDGIVDLKKILEEYGTQSPIKINKTIEPVEIKIILPPKEIAIKLIYRTWNDSCQLFRFYHRTSFIRDVESLYETNPAEYSNHQNKMLPLVYSVIAVGALFSKGDNAIDNLYLQDEGYRYFIASRKLIDITNSTDLESIQTIFMLTLFLQCSARLSTCYSYIGIALRSALRQGLHRKLETKCNYIKAECKKRLFWTIYKMEIYVNSMLGLPNSINESDIDAELPLDIDDENLDYESIKPQKPGKLSSCGINNSHTKLLLILNHIVQSLYKASSPLLMTPVEMIKNLENELKVWLYELPQNLRPNENCPAEYVKANKLLHLDYLHVQIMLWRPFIYYVKVSKNSGSLKACKTYQYENGLKCFEVSKQIIELAEEMINKKLVNGSYWFSIYTIFYAVACLIYYYLEIDKKDKEIISAIERGKIILANLKQKSESAERIYHLLNHMFENYDRGNQKFDNLNNNTSQESNASPLQTNPPLNNFSSPTEDNLVNLPATHTVDEISNAGAGEPKSTPQAPSPVPQSNPIFNVNPQSYIPNGTMGEDDFDLRIFEKFFPASMLNSRYLSCSDSLKSSDSIVPLQGTTANHSIPPSLFHSKPPVSTVSTNDNLTNPLDEQIINVSTPSQPKHTIYNAINDGGSVSGSVNTEDDEHVFDWERFFDKDESVNFEI